MIQVFSLSLGKGRGGMGKFWSARLWVHLFFPFSPNPSFHWKERKFVNCDCHRGYEGPLEKVALQFRIFEQDQDPEGHSKISRLFDLSCGIDEVKRTMSKIRIFQFRQLPHFSSPGGKVGVEWKKMGGRTKSAPPNHILTSLQAPYQTFHPPSNSKYPVQILSN